ncbi:very short patch repair endonuclease [Aminobacterium sp. EBM-42]|uniref:very short patch repair endonuclease n=1 Tax=Aminobacterium sp. EBM-42 TaxID=1918503 RepID=UPI00257C77BA|nr:very short patch repair endonuclease [Aminobacterium sp. EBM-42]
MVDIVSKEKRSQMMSGIRSVDTRPELFVRKALHAKGFRYSLHSTKLPGKPDLVFPRFRGVIFVSGCFWHGHNCHLFKLPSTRRDFWEKKIQKNRERDELAVSQLRHLGWRVLIVWECALKGKFKQNPERIIEEISSWLYGNDCLKVLRGRRDADHD